MRSMYRTVLVASLATFALGAVSASAAQAAEGPFYKLAGARLKAGESKELKAKAGSNMILSWGGVAITCTKQALGAGSKTIGSTGANAGTSEETIKYTGCGVTGNGTSCYGVEEPLTTEPLTQELAYETKERTGGILVLIKPVSGRKFFATLKFVGVCTFGAGPIEGSIAANVFSGGQAVKVGKEPAEAVTSELVFGIEHQHSAHVWVEKEGKLSEETVGLQMFGGAFKFTGETDLTLAGEPKWGVYTK